MSLEESHQQEWSGEFGWDASSTEEFRKWSSETTVFSRYIDVFVRIAWSVAESAMVLL